MNLYGASLSFITAIQTFAGKWIPSKNTRILLSIFVLILSTGTALWASSSFISYFLNFMFALLFILIPWVVINLMDFYYINKKQYDIDSIFDENGGKYGKYNVKTLTAYFIGIVVQIPFLTNSFFTGTFANIIPDVDISWIVGMLVTAVIYYLFNQSKVSARHYGVSTKKY